MNWAVDLTKLILGKELSADYAVIFLLFVIFCISFYLWSIYFAIRKNALNELKSITWYSFKDTLLTTLVVVISILVSSLILFAYDFGLDQLVNLIFNYAK